MTDYEHLIYQHRGPVTIITINRPERMNAIGPQTHRELIDAWNRFRADDTALVGVLTGAGEKAFCAGGDLKAAMAGDLDVVPSGTCLQRAIGLAESIAALPQPALRTNLEAARTGQGRPLEDGLRIEAQCFSRSIVDAETVEGLRRFNERDHPDLARSL
jgi:enoyl-CoA hydratase/carnithine racemase